jgi:hypothetical protein
MTAIPAIPATLCLFPYIWSDLGWFSAKFSIDFHALSALKPLVSTIQLHKPPHPSPAPYVHPVPPKVTQWHPSIGRGTQSQPLVYSFRLSNNSPFACKGHVGLYRVSFANVKFLWPWRARGTGDSPFLIHYPLSSPSCLCRPCRNHDHHPHHLPCRPLKLRSGRHSREHACQHRLWQLLRGQ